MKWLDGYKMRLPFGSEFRAKLVLFGFVAAIVLCGGSANADFTWGTPTNLGPEVNSSYGECGVCISANGLEFYFMSDRPGGYGGFDLWVMERPTIEGDWGDPMNLGSPANSQYSYWEPSISSDGLSLYFSDSHTPQFGNRLPGGLGGQGDIWMITRETIHDAWGAPVNIGPTVNSQHAVHPSISADGLSLYFQSHRPGHIGGHCDIMVATRESTSDSFGNPVFLRNVNSPNGEWMPDISADGRTLFFTRSGATELWVAMRATMYVDFGPPLKLPPQINISSYYNNSPSLSADGSTLYFMSNRPGGVGSYDLWQVSISPVVDFNGDGIVDLDDMHLMVEHWGEDYPLCDIGPMPWGDGIVDAEDLIILAEYLFGDMRCVAHFKLDEAKGSIVNDSARNRDGTVHGSPEWRPTGGVVGGAMLFDGVDDYVSAPFILNPANGPLSVFAWIKGGAPGQVIISQKGDFGGTLLVTNPSEGKLMTGFSDMYFGALVSETVITDMQWHHVGLVYDLDSLHRLLYVDGVLVAEDATVVSGMPSDGGLYIGASKDLDPTSFFSGLIDDVRIYNQALSTEEIAVMTQ